MAYEQGKSGSSNGCNGRVKKRLTEPQGRPECKMIKSEASYITFFGNVIHNNVYLDTGEEKIRHCCEHLSGILGCSASMDQYDVISELQGSQH